MSKHKKTATTAEEIRALISSDESVVLRDSGGFVWWSHEDWEGTFWLHGVATPARWGESGMAVQAWMNIMTPEQAAPYGPFTVIDGAE